MSIQSLSAVAAAVPGAASAKPAASPAAGQSADAPASPAPAPTPQQVENAVAQVQEFLAPVAQNLQFSVDTESGKTVVKLIDAKSQEVLRQIPSEEMLAIARALGRLQGMLVSQKA